MSDQRPNPVVIRFKNEPAGSFEGGVTPSSAGRYAYMPFRNLPHLRMVEAVRAGQKPRCASITADAAYAFTILDFLEPGWLSIVDVEKNAKAP